MKFSAFLLLQLAATLLPSSFVHSQQVNGLTVTRAVYAASSPGQTGNFTMVSEGLWKETTSSGAAHNFTEKNRDEWSVYLYDQSRDISLQLDLYKKEVIIYWDRPNRYTLYSIQHVEAAVKESNNPGNAPPPGFTKCADENGAYYFSGPVDVAYGANGKFYYKYGVSGNISFTNSYFGDPVPGIAKAGFYKASSSIKPIDPADPVDAVNPIDPGDMSRVLKWIANQVADANVAYCYRQSYGRGVGEVLTTCPPGTELSGAICYPLCDNGYTGNGPVCWQVCPPGFRNDPFHCGKPPAYGRGGGYPWKFGDALNLDAARRRCQAENPQGCEKYGEIIYPKCRAGFEPVECCICSPVCPNGMTNIGVSCEKKSYGRGVGSPMGCRAGLEKDGALCYPKCKPGYHPVGPVCWQDCPVNQPVACAAGCARTSADCAVSTMNMVTAVAELAANIISLGSTAKLTAAKAALKTAIKAGDRLAAKAALRQTVKEFVDGFERLTTKKVMNKLREKFEENTIRWVAEEYARVQLKLAMQQEFSTEDLRDLAGLDPTGIAGVVEAFWQPICAKNEPFPALSRNY